VCFLYWRARGFTTYDTATRCSAGTFVELLCHAEQTRSLRGESEVIAESIVCRGLCGWPARRSVPRAVPHRDILSEWPCAILDA